MYWGWGEGVVDIDGGWVGWQQSVLMTICDHDHAIVSVGMAFWGRMIRRDATQRDVT